MATKPSEVNIPLAGEETPRVKVQKKKSRRRRPPRRRVLLLCALALVVTVGLCISVFFGGRKDPAPAASAGSTAIELVVTSPETTRPFGGGILALSPSGYTWYNDKGSSSGFVSHTLRNPVVLTCGSGFLCYSRGGKELYTATAGEIRLSHTTAGNIIHADYNAKQQIALVCDAEYHKGEALVLRSDGEELFSYRSGEAYPYLCALSPDGSHLALAMLLSDEAGNAATALYCFSLKSDRLAGSLVLPGEVIRSLRFHTARGITLITDTAVLRCDREAKLLSEFRLPVGNVLHYAMLGEDSLLITDRRMPGYRYALITVDAEGKEIARLSTDTEYTAAAGGSSYAALLSAAGAEVYGRDLSRLLFREDSADIIAISFAEDGRLCTLTPGKATLTALR
ncbi:MAG: hypothetical protein IKL89_07515 [Clostridia bacterium]|nr:hypothetical protein [Clostridia bacterium]